MSVCQCVSIRRRYTLEGTDFEPGAALYQLSVLSEVLARLIRDSCPAMTIHDDLVEYRKLQKDYSNDFDYLEWGKWLCAPVPCNQW